MARQRLGLTFAGLITLRPGYGYAGIPDPNRDVRAPDDVGVYTVDLETGESRLVVTIAEVAAIPYPHGDISGARHYFNHLLFNTDGVAVHFFCTAGDLARAVLIRG